MLGNKTRLSEFWGSSEDLGCEDVKVGCEDLKLLCFCLQMLNVNMLKPTYEIYMFKGATQL